MTVESLLPPNAAALERNLEQSMALDGDDRDVLIDKVWRPLECPVAVLPFLAWGLGVKRWDPTWPVATRRQVVAHAIRIHRRRGTLGAVEAALDDIGAVHDIEERPGGANFRMKVSVYNSSSLLGTTGLEQLREYVEDVKRFSVHYDIEVAATLDAFAIPVAAGVGVLPLARLALDVDVETPPIVLQIIAAPASIGAAVVPVADFTLGVDVQ